MRQRKIWKDYAFEGSLIVMSVLLALFLSQVAETNRTKRLKKEALANIEAELERNLEVVEGWMALHETVNHRLDGVISGQDKDRRQVLASGNYFEVGVLTDGQPIIDANLSSTAWETAQSTRIVAEFDFETVQTLTSVYSLQAVLMDTTLPKFIEIYFDRRTHDLDNLESTLIQFKLAVSELLGQERMLAQTYREVIESLD